MKIPVYAKADEPRDPLVIDAIEVQRCKVAAAFNTIVFEFGFRHKGAHWGNRVAMRKKIAAAREAIASMPGLDRPRPLICLEPWQLSDRYWCDNDELSDAELGRRIRLQEQARRLVSYPDPRDRKLRDVAEALEKEAAKRWLAAQKQ